MSEAKKDKHLEFWRTVYDELQHARDTLPYSDEPRRIHWDHPDDDWKNDAAVQAHEDDCSAETDALMIHYCFKQSWPKRSKNNARYFAEHRIKWALGFVRVFTIPLPDTSVAAIPRPPQSGWELLKWLLVEAYHQRFPPPTKTPFYISGSDGKTMVGWS